MSTQTDEGFNALQPVRAGEPCSWMLSTVLTLSSLLHVRYIWHRRQLCRKVDLDSDLKWVSSNPFPRYAFSWELARITKRVAEVVYSFCRPMHITYPLLVAYLATSPTDISMWRRVCSEKTNSKSFIYLLLLLQRHQIWSYCTWNSGRKSSYGSWGWGAAGVVILSVIHDGCITSI